MREVNQTVEVKDAIFEARSVAIVGASAEPSKLGYMTLSPLIKGGDEVVKQLASTIKASVAVSYMGGGEKEARGRISIQCAGIPVFPSPERALRGIEAVVWRAEYCKARGYGLERSPG